MGLAIEFDTTPKRGNFQKVIFAGDFHIPFHDTKLLQLFYTFLRSFLPDKLFLIGDILDCYSLSNFDKDPKRLFQLQEELDLANTMLDTMQRIVPEIEVWEGNHEFRIIKYLRRHPELYGLDCLTWRELLKLRERKITFHDYMEKPYQFHGFQIHHGKVIRKYSGWTAKGNWERYGGSGICGHSHRGGSFIKRTMQEIVGWYEGFCLCSLDPEYLDFADWIQGWSVAYFSEGDLFHLEQIPVIEHKFLFNGKMFEIT